MVSGQRQDAKHQVGHHFGVAFDPDGLTAEFITKPFSNDFVAVDGKRVEDVKESNWGSWRHTISHYFAGTELRKRLIQAIS